jgi:hypothetical protein
VGIGFNLFGILGALFAAPVLASLRVMGGYIHAKLLDYPPFQNQPIPPDQRSSTVYRRTVRGEDLPPSTRSRLKTEDVTEVAEVAHGESTGEAALVRYTSSVDLSTRSSDTGFSAQDVPS